MKSNLEVILDTEPSGGCGCNCGCGGATVVDDMNELVDNLKEYKFKNDIDIEYSPIQNFDRVALINKINELLDNTNAAFRVTTDNLDETLSNILPLIVLDGNILTAYGVPTLNDIIMEVEKSL